MEPNPEHLDLEAIQHRYDLVTDTPSGEVGETMQEWRDRVDLELAGRAHESADDVPALIAEIRRLQQLLHPAADPLAPGWNAAINALRIEAEGWRNLNPSDLDRWNRLHFAAETLVRLDRRPRLTTTDVWLRTSPTMRQKCQAWWDSTREGWVLDEHPLLLAEELAPQPRDPDWYIAQQGADAAYHRMGEES